jgi:hypothetical protein
MSDQTPPPSSRSPEIEPISASHVDFEGAGSVTVEGDVAGRDVVKNTTNVGFSAAAVQRLLLIVGGLVFVTAACFFASGLVVGGAIVAVLNKPVAVADSAAASMQASIDTLQALPPGTPFQQTFTEVELNSYWELVIGPQIGLTPGTGAARLLDNNRVLLAGKFAALGNLKALAVVEPRVNTPGQLFKVDSAAIQVLPLGNSSLGWVPVPAGVLQPVMDGVNRLFGSKVELTGASVSGPALTVNGVGR